MRRLIAVFLLCALLTAALPAWAESDEDRDTASAVPVLSAFNTVDLAGNPVDLSLLEGAKLILVNIWEPWCGPCKAEMPDLSELYEQYREQGLLIVGVSGMTSDFPEETAAVTEELQIAYPLVQWQDGLIPFTVTAYPTTFGLIRAEDGSLVIDGYLVGALSRNDWETIILHYLSPAEE